ncbi:MAG: hypothetical protein K6G55_04365 [Selenomonadaceae bacterium]|nr:hypothetical protein [Selenomonadaceae bacterium]
MAWNVENGKATYPSGSGNIVLNGVSSGLKASGDNLISGISGGVPEGAIHITADNIGNYSATDEYYGDIYNLTSGTYYIDSAIDLGEYSVRVKEGATLYILDGADISYEGSNCDALANSGTVNITGGSFAATGEYSFALINEIGTVNISGGTVSGYFALTNLGTANISGGSLTGTLANDGKANITGGTFTSTGEYRTALNNRSNGTANISGGSFSAIGKYGIAMINNGTVNITGGEFSAAGEYGAALSNFGGTVNISGGSFAAISTSYSAALNNSGTANVYSTTGDSTGAYANFNGTVRNVENVENNVGTINYGTNFNDITVEQFNAYVSSQVPTLETKTVAGISGNVINIYDNAIFGSDGAVTVSANDGSLAFNIGENVTGKFYGTGGVDNITVNGSACVNGQEGDDTITNGGNGYASMSGGKGNDVLIERNGK